MENKCESNACETKPQTPCQTEECCPVETSIAMWKSAFCDAMHEVQVDILKKKIQGAWGGPMEKAADAILEAMGTKWQSMLANGKAQVDLREKIVKIWSEGKK
jgi:hypothetical protein